MATKTITLTYPDGSGSRIVAALKQKYGQIYEVATGIHRDRTNAEAFAAFEAECKAMLKSIVMESERAAASQAAADAVTDPGVS